MPPSGHREPLKNKSLSKQASCFDITNSEPANLSLASAGAVVSGSLTELAESPSSPLWLSPAGSNPGEDSETSGLFMTSGPDAMHTDEVLFCESSVTALRHRMIGE